MPLEFLPMTNDDRWLTLVSTSVSAPLFGEPDGYDGEGLDSEGYNRYGFNAEGVDRQGYDGYGYKEDEHGERRDRNGFDAGGYDEDGYDEEGFDRDGYDRDGYDEAGYDEDGENRNGYGRTGSDSRWLENDEPEYVFKSTTEDKLAAEGRGTYTAGKRVPDIPYYGMEIELTSDCNSSVRRIIQQEYKDIVWAKPDCSVDGFEMVTHPMTFAWAQQNFPWEIVNELGNAGCEVMEESNGLHIHVSRAGFTNWAHQFRWVKMFYRMENQIGGYDGMAGREADEWGAFRSRDREEQFTVLKGQMINSRGGYARFDHPRRYCALNLQNSHTIEARVFTSTIEEETLRMRFELMAASVEYTRHLTVGEISNGGWEYEAFVQWLLKNSGTYPALERRCVPALTLA